MHDLQLQSRQRLTEALVRAEGHVSIDRAAGVVERGRVTVRGVRRGGAVVARPLAVGGADRAASWLILPIRGRDVARARMCRARYAIENGDNDAARDAIAQLDLIAPAFNARRRLHRLLPSSHRRDGFLADTFDELRTEFSRADHAGSR